MLACLAGLVGVLLFGGFIRELLFQTSPRDPLVLGTVAGLLLLSGVLATLLPAWRATRVDPATTLKAE